MTDRLDLIADTLAMMALIDRTEEFADCFLWQGSTTSTGAPTYKPNNRPCTLVRREIFRLAGGVLLARQPVDCTCGEKLCINPQHLFLSTFKKVGKKAAEKGAWKGVARASKIAQTKRKHAKLTPEIAAAIRESDETGPVLAARHGVHRSVITGIKTGKRWKQYGGHFFGLGARGNNTMKNIANNARSARAGA